MVSKNGNEHRITRAIAAHPPPLGEDVGFHPIPCSARPERLSVRHLTMTMTMTTLMMMPTAPSLS